MRRRTFYVRAVVMCVTLAAVASLAPPASAHVPGELTRKQRHVRARARDQIGTPYSYGGSSPSGFDCSGLTRWTFDGHGASLPRTSIEQWELGARDGHKRIWKRSKLRVGDLVFHKTTSARVGHVGIFIGDGRFISTTSSEGVRVRSLYDKYYWGPRWVGATRLRRFMGSKDGGGDSTSIRHPLQEAAVAVLQKREVTLGLVW